VAPLVRDRGTGCGRCQGGRLQPDCAVGADTREVLTPLGFYDVDELLADGVVIQYVAAGDLE
jgi:hypothetical protein